MADRLSHKQTAAMFALMVTAREVSNPDLTEIAGFPLNGAERRQLNDLGLVVSSKQGRCYVHELTDDGWAWCSAELAEGTPPPPQPRSLLVGSFYLVLASLHRYLARQGHPLSEVFRPVVDLTAEQIEDRIREAYTKLARRPQDWVRLADLRPLLDGAPSAEVDAVLLDLSKLGAVHLAPLSDRKRLTPADHAAAIRVGGADSHLVVVEAS
ncbi:hypothetical protein [Actinokineospora bangkokensis]|uniref:Uncharacterized protein n=1 Tax=Actinokineospora bangkokensis TaxID=1193682 RepID=A0A1Q9LQQ5_9PSEU|nr:hypothetical protein [Actinokineospora bangkokensis]OLR94350.1 hypothetical protein BJP25_11325 [Actinokineospora bangkokensis]